MDRREHIDDPVESTLGALDARQANTWTALPGIVQSFDAVAMTCTVQPAIQMLATKQDGTFENVSLPLLLDCPVQFPAGGGVTLTFPIKPGDEALIIFSARCIDAWWQSGGVQVQAELRMHDLSDGFVLVGVRSQPRVIPNVSTSTAQLRNDAGDTFVELDPEGQVVTITAPGGVVINANVTINGDTQQNGKIDATGDVTGAGISLETHTHGQVEPGAGNTGVPQ